MKRKINSYDFWPVFGWVTGICYFFGIIAIFSVWVIRTDRTALYHFQHDLFAALSGQEIQYERADAQKIAGILKEIPAERLDEDLNYLALLSMGNEDTREEKKEYLAMENPSKMERIVLYADVVENWSGDGGHDFRDTVLDLKLRISIKSVLQGGAVPQIESLPQPFSFFSIGWCLLLVAAITQFAAFGIYALLLVCDKYNPLLGLPEGVGSKIVMLITLPGSFPLMVLILLFSGAKGAGTWLSSRYSAKRVRPTYIPNLSGQSSRDTLERIRRRLEGKK